MDPLLLIVIVLIILWAAGWGFAIGGGLVHVLLVIIAVLVIYRLLTGKKPIL